MALFKKNISLSQFVADAINNSISFYESNSDRMIDLADEYNVMEEKDKNELKEFGYALIIADLMLSGQIHFGDRISNEEFSKLVGFIYVKFLKEVKNMEENEIEKRTNVLEKILGTLESSEDRADGTADGLRFLLCSIFSELYAEGEIKDQKVQGKRFAAFKMAKAVIKSDLINIMLKEFKVDFSHLPKQLSEG